MRADAGRWERGRRPIAAALHRSGSLLDVGCANGVLMESIARWAAEAGHDVEPYGLDHSPELAALAWRRMPRWSDRISVGNVVAWTPPRRFDFVRPDFAYVPTWRQADLVERLLRVVVAVGGRLIVCTYGSAGPGAERAEAIGDFLRGWGHAVAGEASGVDTNGVVITRVAWVDAGPPASE